MAKKTEGKINKSEAVRQTLKAGIENPTDGSKHIKDTFGLDVTPQVFSTIKSITNNKKTGKKKALRAVAAGPGVVGNGKASSPADLARQVKLLVAQHGAAAVSDMAKVFAD
jgi:histidine ammonia-lyase